MRKATLTDGNFTYLKAIIINIVVQFVFSAVYSAVAIINGWDLTEIAMPAQLVAMLMLQAGFFVAVATSYGGKKKPDLPLIRKQVSVKNVLLSLFLAVVIVACFSWLGEWFYVFLDAIGYHTTTLEFNGAFEIIAAVIITVLVAPVTEESVFRGALLGGLKTRYKKWACIALSGLCFSLMHMSAEQTVHQFFLGCVCALVTFESGNFIYGIIIHSGNNLIALLLGFFGESFMVSKAGNASVLLDNIALSVPLTVLAAAIGVVAVIFIAKAMRTKQEKQEWQDEPPKASFVSPKTALIIGIVICVVMWVSNFWSMMIL